VPPGAGIKVLTEGESTMNTGPAPATVVLVHGGFVDGQIATMQHLARENRMYVIGINPVLHAGQIRAGFPGRDRLLPAAYLEANGPWLEEGNTVIAAPSGEILAGPVRQREETLIADLDLRQAAIGRRHLDPVGHYNRADIFRLDVGTSPRPAVTETVIGGTDDHRTSGALADNIP
jgi:nitrilase